MDSRSNLEATTVDTVVQTVDVPESGDSRKNVKRSDMVNTSLENNDEKIITDTIINVSKEQPQKTEINELGINVTSLSERDDLIGKEPFNSHISNLVTSSAIDEITPTNFPEQYLDRKTTRVNDMKLFPDDESCSDMQDEEIQLRWDDDDINLDCVDVGSLGEKSSICKDIKDMTVENMDLENTPEKINDALLDVDNVTDKNLIDICEKNVSQHESQECIGKTKFETINTQQDATHPSNEHKQCVSQNICNEIIKTNECLTILTNNENNLLKAQVNNETSLIQTETEPNTNLIDNNKSITQQEHEETETLINNEQSDTRQMCEDIVTKVNNNISQSENVEMQIIIEKQLIQQGKEGTVAQVHNEIKDIKGKDDVGPLVGDEKNVIFRKCEEITTQHGLKKPDMMLEIPSQELIDFMDEDEPDLLGNLEISSDETVTKISHDNNYDVNDAVTAINTDVEIENIKTPIECEQEASRHNEKNPKMLTKVKDVTKDHPEFCPDSISPLILKELNNKEKEQNILMGEPQPSTSKACIIMEMRRDSDEVGEVSDSLGLLAESTRVLEDDEEQEDEDDADDDYDYDQYEESSNQMGAEFSEDCNALISETDTAKFAQSGIVNVDKCKSKENTVVDYMQQENESCGFHISDIKTQSDEHQDISKNTEQISDSEIFIVGEGDQVNEKASKSLVDDIDNKKDTDGINTFPGDQRQDTESYFTVIESSISSPNVPQDTNLDKEEIVLLESSSDEDLSVDIANIVHEVTIPCMSIDLPSVSQPVECQSNDSPQTPKKSNAACNKNLENDDSEKSSQHKLTLNLKLKSPRGLEVFSIDSDEDDMIPKHNEEKSTWGSELCEGVKCVNIACGSLGDVQYYEADAAVLKYYEADRRKKAAVCELCADVVFKRNKELIEGIKNNTPLLELNIGKQVVEISDSDSEKEEEAFEENNEKIGEAGAKFLEEKLEETFNTTWKIYNMDSRLEDAKSVMQQELSRLDKDCQEINQMLNECQSATDKLRNELYATFEQERKQLLPITIFDTEYSEFCEYEDTMQEKLPKTEKRTCKQKSVNYVPAKKPAIVTSLENVKQEIKPEHSLQKTVDDDSVDVSVVKLSLESAPADLPQPGEVVKPQLRTGMTVYAMRSSFGTWLKAKIIEIQSKAATCTAFTMCRLKFEHKVMRNAFITLPARCIAFEDPPDVRLTIGTRIIASSEKTESFYSGVVAEVPNPVNNYRYLVFFDDGHAKYARHANTRLVSESSPLVWEEVHPNSRDFVRQYLLSYPERPMVRLHPNQNVKTEWNGKWWSSRVLEVDASLALILLQEERLEWIYRGSTRLGPLYLEFQAAERQRSRPMPRSGPQNRTNMPYVEYTRYDEPQPPKPQNEETRRQRAVAKKSTVSHQLPPVPPPNNAANLDNVTSRVVYYTPKNTIRPYKMIPHQCGPKCKRTDVLALEDLRTYNPLAKPLLSAWERQIVRFKCHKEVMYRAPCGRRLRNMEELHRYLRIIKSDMPVDLFDFGPSTHCLAEFVLNKCIVGKKDLSHGKENVPVPCVNYYDDSLPEFCSYNTERTPTAGVPLNLNPEFLCGCDCDDDCQDKTKCACWKMTLEGARTIGLEGDVGYEYRRLPEPLPSGIYECNSRCKCKNTCLNRVAQHPLQLKLQVFKTLNRGWGIRALNDVPKGAFLCVYAGNLLTDATANLDGLNEGDEYLAELDYIEIVEQMKEGYEEDIPENLKELDKDRSTSDECSEEETSSSEEEDLRLSKDERDDDFQPGYVTVGPMEFNKRLRTREKRKKEKPANTDQEDAVEKKDDELEEEREVKPEEKREDTGRTEGQMEKDEDKDNVDNFITISDDEEVREPSRFTAQAGMNSKQLVSKYRSVRSHFGKDEACYIMDAKVQGNIGRYLNHSCCPNVFVQNVFVDTHDPRFPWVAFFALSHIRAGTELTWNYNYDVGSVPGKILYCYCGAVNCRGRLL